MSKTFSLQERFKAFNLDLTGQRLETFKRALALPVLKRDALWLERLKIPAEGARVETPEDWTPVITPFHDGPSRKNEKSVFYLLQHALYSRAFYRKVKDGEIVEMPVFSAEVWPFLLIHVEKGASVTIVDDDGFEATEATPFRSVMVFAGVDSRVTWAGFQHHAEEVTSYDHKWFHLEAGASLKNFQHGVGGARNFDETVVELAGDGSSVRSQIVFFGHAHQHHEMRVNHVHVGRDTVSHMVSKGAVKDAGHGGFLGNIQMEPGCSGADGQLEEHNLLLSSGSKIDAIPGLEIGHHDVKAGHAAYMEKVDEEKLFYAAARGIPQEEAIQLIVEGFFKDAISRMGVPEMEKRVFNLILSRL